MRKYYLRKIGYYFCQLIEHCFWKPIVRTVDSVHRVSDEYPLVAVVDKDQKGGSQVQIKIRTFEIPPSAK